MNAVEIGEALCKKWEGCKLTAYPDPATGAEPWTIGYGSTGPGIVDGTIWTQAQADEDLQHRLQGILYRIESACPANASDNQLGACMSLAYNVGVNGFLMSILLRTWKAGDVIGAADQFLTWDKAAGRVMQGLLNRRQDERRVFLGGDPS